MRHAKTGRRVAVVIGVGESKILPPLPGAAKGAAAFADWADATCGEVHRFIDQDGPIRRAEIFTRIASLTDGTVSQLLIYYSGHGLASSVDEDYWVLSGAAADPSEVVDVRTSLDNARAYSRIRHVVVFADACRTIAGKQYAQSMRGAAPIFPSPLEKAIGINTVVDVFYATKTGEVALERAPNPLGQEEVERAIVGTHGFFTEALLPVLRGEVPEYLRPNLDTGATVLYAQNLAVYLSVRVPLMTGKAALLSQEADSRPASSHPLFIAELKRPQAAALTIEAYLPDGSLAEKARVSILDLTNPLCPRDLETSTDGRVSRVLPQNVYYGAKAFLADHQQQPASPNPVTFLFTDLPPVAVELLPISRGPARPRARQAPSLLETFLIDAAGEAYGISPRDGVFSVVSRDVLSGRTATEVQVLTMGTRPSLNQPLEADPAAERRLDSEVELHTMSRSLRDHFEARIGLSVVGAHVVGAATKDDLHALLSVERDGRSFSFLRGLAPGSAILALEEERYAAAVLFPDFIGSLSVGPAGVRSLSYAPSANSDYYEEEPDLLHTRALAEAAVRSGRFDVVIDSARPFAEKLRRHKHIDPVLGVLAAYAYHRAGDKQQIRNMIDYFLNAGQFVPFDLLMLGGVKPASVSYRFAPSFPLLSQGWRLLGDDDRLPPTLADARLHLAPSLWATVIGPAGRELAEAVRQGEIP
jgi:hypothetical protein